MFRMQGKELFNYKKQTDNAREIRNKKVLSEMQKAYLA